MAKEANNKLQEEQKERYKVVSELNTEREIKFKLAIKFKDFIEEESIEKKTTYIRN